MLKLKIVSPERIEFDGEVVSVLVPGSQGQFEILNDHAPIISTLDKGVVEYGLPKVIYRQVVRLQVSSAVGELESELHRVEFTVSVGDLTGEVCDKDFQHYFWHHFARFLVVAEIM